MSWVKEHFDQRWTTRDRPLLASKRKLCKKKCLLWRS